MKDYKFMVFRVYSEKERCDYRERSVFYGWTKSKAVLKAFMKQRDNKKYHVTKMFDEDIARIYSEDITDYETMINYLVLKSAATHESFKLFMTAKEMKNAEIAIQRYFSNLASLSNIKGDGNYIQLFINIDDYYAEALDYIGFRPPEVEMLFPSAEYRGATTSLEATTNAIEDAYSGSIDHPQEEVDAREITPPGLSMLEDVSKKILYSLESFIKVLREDF